MNSLTEHQTSSVALRISTEGDCTCGFPYPSGSPPPVHEHHIECDWGRIEYPDPRPLLGQVGHLVLVPGVWAAALLNNGPEDDRRYGRVTVTNDADRLFIHMDFQGKRWTWQLFNAHFADGKGPDRMLVGVWPD